MSTFSVPVVTVRTVSKHPNADALDILSFEEIGWQCVDKKDARKVGDRVVYIPIDSVVKTTRPEFSFLASKAKKDGTYRIRTIRLRGEISQGLVLALPEDFTTNTDEMDKYFEIIKYEPPPETVPSQAAGNYPSWCEKSDAERYQAYNRVIEPYAEELFYQTLKMDGTSMTVFYEDGRLGVCSRNWEIKQPELGEEDLYWRIAREYKLLEFVENLARESNVSRIALQGEICGPGIQGNKMGLARQEFFAFDIYNGDENEFLPYGMFLAICHNIQTVKLLGCNKITATIGMNFISVTTLKYDNGKPAEGAVFVAATPRRVGSLGRLKFKFISPVFLLEYES